MKHRFLAHDPDAQSLTIFFAGWGSSPERFRDLRPAGGQDLFLLWDFDGAVGALPDLSRYETVDVVGWSLGVRIAADWVMESPVPVRRFTAVAGTLTPIDRRLGIPPVVFDRTTDRFGEATLEGFLLNMTGSVEAARTLRGTERTRRPSKETFARASMSSAPSLRKPTGSFPPRRSCALGEFWT